MIYENDTMSGCSVSLCNFKPNTVSVILGQRSCGKTTFAINKIYRDLSNDIDNLYIFTELDNNKYKDISNKCYKLNDFESIYSIIKAERKNNSTLFIFDDKKLYNKQNKFFEELLVNGKHYNITSIFITNSVVLSPCLSSHIDYFVFAK